MGDGSFIYLCIFPFEQHRKLDRFPFTLEGEKNDQKVHKPSSDSSSEWQF